MITTSYFSTPFDIVACAVVDAQMLTSIGYLKRKDDGAD